MEVDRHRDSLHWAAALYSGTGPVDGDVGYGSTGVELGVRNGIAVFMTISKSANDKSISYCDKSNMNRILATISLQNQLTNSRCPPRSQIENVIAVRLTEIVFSMKVTPRHTSHEHVAKPPEMSESQPSGVTYRAFGCTPHRKFPPRNSPSDWSSQRVTNHLHFDHSARYACKTHR